MERNKNSFTKSYRKDIIFSYEIWFENFDYDNE